MACGLESVAGIVHPQCPLGFQSHPPHPKAFAYSVPCVVLGTGNTVVSKTGSALPLES